MKVRLVQLQIQAFSAFLLLPLLVACGRLDFQIRDKKDLASISPVTLSVADTSGTEGADLQFTVSLSRASSEEVTFLYSTQDNTALAGTDYTGVTNASHTIPVGSTSATLTIPTLTDSNYEGDKLMGVQLSSIQGASGLDSLATGTIQDSTPAPSISVADVVVAEGTGAGTTNAVFTITLSSTSDVAARVTYTTSAATALGSGADYTSTSGTLTIAIGQTQGSVTVPITRDALFETNETFSLSLSSPANATLLDGTGVATITDDDTAPTLSIADTNTTEGSNADFTVTLSAASGRETTVSYATSNGTALAGTHYTSTSGTLTIAAGSTTSPITVPTTNEALASDDRTFALTLSSPSNATLSTSIATGTIYNNDAPTITSVSPSSGPSGGGTTITITGTGFLSGAGVTIDGSNCTSLSVNSSTEITCTTPLGAVGAADVVATNTLASQPHGARSVTSTSAYTYTGPALSPLTPSLITGESITFAASGGTPAYTYSDGGSGYLNAATGVYTAPLNITPFSETVTATDAALSTATTNVKVRAFEPKDTFSLGMEGSSSFANGITIDSSNNLYAYGEGGDANRWWIVKKSTDGGASWNVVDKYIHTLGKANEVRDLTVDGSGVIYAVGGSKDTSYLDHWIVRKSTDSGATWTTVDDFSRGKNAKAQGVRVDGSGNLYVAGYEADVSNVWHWFVRKSTDGGSTWSTVDDYVLAAGRHALAVDVAVDGSGNLYVAGAAQNSSGIQTWMVRKSTDGGATWSIVDSYNLAAADSSITKSIVIDGAGHLYVAGSGFDISGVAHSIVRKSTDGGATWSTVENYNLVAGKGSHAFDIQVVGTGNLYVVGYSSDSSDDNRWIVRKSTDGGATWTTIDNYALAAGESSLPYAVAIDSNGNIYVAGYGTAYVAPEYHWIVRKSIDAGATWATIEDFQMPIVAQAVGLSVLEDSSGNLYVAGEAKDSSGVVHWVVRKSTDTGATWSTVDNYNLAAGKGARAFTVVLDGSGNLYVAGEVRDNSDMFRWMVRKSTNNGSTWSVVDDYLMAGGERAEPHLAKIDGAGNLYVVGTGYDSNWFGHWIVRKSTDSGATWTTVDDYLYPGSEDTNGNGLTIDALGNLYVTGTTYDSNWYGRWVVRKSTNGGATWTTVDDYGVPGAEDSYSVSVTTDASGNVYVAGEATDINGVYRWTVRKSKDAGATWTTIDYPMPTGGDAMAFGINTCGLNQICVVGKWKTELGGESWGVRILSP